MDCNTGIFRLVVRGARCACSKTCSTHGHACRAAPSLMCSDSWREYVYSSQAWPAPKLLLQRTVFRLDPQARVTLNNGTGATSVNATGPSSPQLACRWPRQVLVTPLRVPTVRSDFSPISKVLIKAVKSDGKKVDGKTFTLRNIDPSKVKTCDQLKSVVRAQLQDDICTADFDVGYLQNNTVVSLRSPEDMQEIWSNIMKGTKV